MSTNDYIAHLKEIKVPATQFFMQLGKLGGKQVLTEDDYQGANVDE